MAGLSVCIEATDGLQSTRKPNLNHMPIALACSVSGEECG